MSKILNINIKKFYTESYSRFPYDGNVEDLYIIFRSKNLKVVKYYFNYYILKWIREKNIELSYDKKALGFYQKVNFNIRKDIKSTGFFEKRFFDIVFNSCNINHVLSAKTVSRNFKDNINKLKSGINLMKIISLRKMEENNVINVENNNG